MIAVLKLAWHVGRRLTKNIVIRNYREHCAGKPAGRALLSYLPHPLLPPARLRDRSLFSPFGLAQQIPRVLNEMGYAVDIVAFDNKRWRPRRTYDLFIGHGAINFERLAETLGPNTLKLYFATGLYWREWNRRGAERLYDLAQRTGWLLSPERTVSIDEDGAYTAADGIIHLGNECVGATYASFPNVRAINNASYPANWDGWQRKDYAAARRHFLYYEGPGNLHKGLDRVLEAFAGLPFHLHVCQHIDPAFRRAYKSLLAHSPNIHLYGFIRQRSAQFYELVKLCGFVVSATCAEGQPGSLIEMMTHGLIPIAPRESNIDLGPWGLRLPGCSAAQIGDTCTMAASLPVEQCQSMAAGVIAETRERYSVEHFRSSFRQAVLELAQSAPCAARPSAEVSVP